MHILTWLWTVLAVVLLFGATVFVHEFGHFLMARRCGLKVEGFSIGFGPKIFGWTRNGVDYALRWIPAGGYVKLPQMQTSEIIEGRSEAILPSIRPGAKILVSLAGPVMNALFGVVIAVAIYFVGLPVRLNPAVIGLVDPTSAEAKLGIQTGDRVVAVAGQSVSSWEDAQTAAALALTNVLPVTIEHEGIKHVYHLNTQFNEELGVKMLNLDPLDHPTVLAVQAGSAAESSGLKDGDEILSLAGTHIVSQGQLIKLIRKKPGVPVSLEIRRGEQHLTLTATPQKDPQNGTGKLGIEISPGPTVYQVQRPGPPPLKLVADVSQQIFGMFGALLHSRQSGVGLNDLSGPPGILAVLASQVRADYRLALKFMVLLNINLALLNLLPLPVLDGGHIALALLEKLRGKPLSTVAQEYATTVFAFLLISFMLYVSYNDVVRRFPLFHSLFNEQVQIEQAPTK